MYDELVNELNARNVTIIKVVDISLLPVKVNRGFPFAIIIGLALNPEYILKQLNESIVDHTEFGEKEHLADETAEWIADFIIAKGYRAFAQSERNLINGYYDEKIKTTSLPHKTIALMAGLGWIGKNNLLVTPEFGSAICLCTVLTDAPLPTKNKPIMKPLCGTCTICKDICPTGVIHGMTWEPGMSRDFILDVYHCDGCLKCLINCYWTKKYAKNRINVNNNVQ